MTDGENKNAPDRYAPERLNQDFIKSAAISIHTGTRENFSRKLKILREFTRRNIFQFSLSELDAYLNKYQAAGYPMVSHSDIYRAAYHPAYRVIAKSVSLPYLIDRVRDLARVKSRALIAIDGRCASGKSTLAERLAAAYGWSVIHMDDFFLRPSQRTPERYAEAGGNLDRERVLNEILMPLRAGNPEICYQPFDCHAMRLKNPVIFNPARVIILEGSYSCHPDLWDFYDFHVFVTIDPETQAARILKRDGPESAGIFSSRWIPMEERYFSAFSIQQRCDFILSIPESIQI